MKTAIMVASSVILGVFGQLFMKKGMSIVGGITSIDLNTITQIFLNPWVVAGLACYGLAMVIWLGVLAELDLSLAYPMLSLGYIIVALGSWWMFGENISAIRWVGIFIIIGGVIFISKK